LDNAMKMCAQKDYSSIALELYETLHEHQPDHIFPLSFYSNLIFCLLKNNQLDDCFYILRRVPKEDMILSILGQVLQFLPKDEKLKFNDRTLLSRFDQLRNWAMEEIKLTEKNELLSQMNDKNLLTFGDCLLYDVHAQQTNDWLPKQIQIEKIFIEWMNDNKIENILHSLDTTKWFSFIHPQRLALPLARFLTNHGNLNLAIDFLYYTKSHTNLNFSVTSLTFEILISNHSLDFACLYASEKTRQQNEPLTLDDIFLNGYYFFQLFNLKPEESLISKLKLLCRVENTNSELLCSKLKLPHYLHTDFEFFKLSRIDDDEKNKEISTENTKFLDGG